MDVDDDDLELIQEAADENNQEFFDDHNFVNMAHTSPQGSPKGSSLRKAERDDSFDEPASRRGRGRKEAEFSDDDEIKSQDSHDSEQNDIIDLHNKIMQSGGGSSIKNPSDKIDNCQQIPTPTAAVPISYHSFRTGKDSRIEVASQYSKNTF